MLVGDDEHGWSPHGVFNVEGGVYLKIIRLSKEGEPEAYRVVVEDAAGTLIENVVLENGKFDLNDDSITENTRAAVGLGQLNITGPQCVGHPTTIYLITCDIFGVLPPIALLDRVRRDIWFELGPTTKVAGTERGGDGFTFCACFNKPFSPRHIEVYMKLWKALTHMYDVNVFLINTGYCGGPLTRKDEKGFTHVNRFSIPDTRRLVAAARAGEFTENDCYTDERFGFLVPRHVDGLSDQNILIPRDMWTNPIAYDEQADEFKSLIDAKIATLRK